MKKLNHLRKRVNAITSISKDLWVGANLACRLPYFLQHPLTSEKIKSIVRERLERREDSFLSILRTAIYPQPKNPYRQLLDTAGFEYGDINKLVRKDGVEETLQVMFKNGVYLSVDEFKGRRPIIRGSFKMEVQPGFFRNPFSSSHLLSQSSGSRGARTAIYYDLARVPVEASVYYQALRSPSVGEKITGLWMGPGGADLKLLLIFCSMGYPLVRWFVRAGEPSQQHISWKLRTVLLTYGSIFGGVRIPEPLYVSHENPLPIAHWMAEVLKAGNTPFLFSFASSAVRLCNFANDAGIDLRGATFIMAGEPITENRLEIINRTGAKAIPIYASGETGVIGAGCFNPDAADDVHLSHDLYALIQPEGNGTKIPQRLFISSVAAKTPFIMLNLSLGDQAIISNRKCDCLLQNLGWESHLHTIRSYEKLTAAGITMLDSDLINVLEKFLPGRFGGCPTDYQLLEEETEGEPRLTLLIDPEIGLADTNLISEAFLEGIRACNSRLWRIPGFFNVERRKPILAASGKILHLHVGRKN